MVTNRYLEPADYEALAHSLAMDKHHSNTPLEFFTQTGTVCSVYEDDKGIVLFARGEVIELINPETALMVKVLKLDLQFMSNNDAKRNMRTMLEGFPRLAILAKNNGFDVVAFESDVELLRQFCIRRLGFESSIDNWLVRML